jgi:hypothetical protein
VVGTVDGMAWTCTRAGLLDAEKRGHWV